MELFSALSSWPRNHALKGGQSFYEASRWKRKILFFCGAAIRCSRISLSVQALSVFFFPGIVLSTVRISRRWREREREMHNADLVVVALGCCSLRRARQVRNPRVFISPLSSSSLRRVTIEQMRCGYVLSCNSRRGRFKGTISLSLNFSNFLNVVKRGLTPLNTEVRLLNQRVYCSVEELQGKFRVQILDLDSTKIVSIFLFHHVLE